VSFDLDDDFVVATISDGQEQIHVAATVAFDGEAIILRGFHIHGRGANTLGIATLHLLARWLKEKLDVRQLRIEGAARASGAGPGRIPRALIF
jgi:hypothetical protein